MHLNLLKAYLFKNTSEVLMTFQLILLSFSRHKFNNTIFLCYCSARRFSIIVISSDNGKMRANQTIRYSKSVTAIIWHTNYSKTVMSLGIRFQP